MLEGFYLNIETLNFQIVLNKIIQLFNRKIINFGFYYILTKEIDTCPLIFFIYVCVHMYIYRVLKNYSFIGCLLPIVYKSVKYLFFTYKKFVYINVQKLLTMVISIHFFGTVIHALCCLFLLLFNWMFYPCIALICYTYVYS